MPYLPWRTFFAKQSTATEKIQWSWRFPVLLDVHATARMGRMAIIRNA
jgi:hypothetical protein